MPETNLSIISWDGDIDDVTYIIPATKVDEFMRLWNDHGRWHVVSDARNIFMMMGD